MYLTFTRNNFKAVQKAARVNSAERGRRRKRGEGDESPGWRTEEQRLVFGSVVNELSNTPPSVTRRLPVAYVPGAKRLVRMHIHGVGNLIH
jgi:hypothetical protein